MLCPVTVPLPQHPLPLSPRPFRSAILPVASAFATTGAVLGIIIALVVGATNVYTCTLLIRGAQYTGTRDYESFSHAVGGAWYKVRACVCPVVQCSVREGAWGFMSGWVRLW